MVKVLLEKLKNEVYEANKQLKELGLVIRTWGNVSGFDKETGNDSDYFRRFNL